jgi:pimeloyl-ACP methyl ester carboxylesterase
MHKLMAAAVAAALAWSTQAASAEIDWKPYELKLRSGASVAGEIGSIDVPLHHDRPAAGTLTLSFVRLPATGGIHGAPIVYLAGGPGGSGIEAARGDRWPLFDTLRRQGDVILLDQRGVGLSSPPPACSTPWRFPADEASTEAGFNRSLEAAVRVCAADWRAKGVDLAAYNTADNAEDVADLARVLGGKVRLVAISYGTFLGLQVLRDHSDLVERAAFAGVEGPDDTVKLPLQADHALARLARLAAKDPKAAALTPDLEASLRKVLDRLGREPAWGETKGPDGKPVRVRISRYDMQVVVAFLLATSPNAAIIPGLAADMEKGDFASAARMVLWLRRFLSNLPAMALATDAASGASAARLARVKAEVKRSLFGNAVNMPSADFASALGVPELPARWRTAVRSSTPTLFISGTLDSRTPPENAETARRGFASSAHLVLDGAAHDNDLFLSSPVILQRIDAFLAGEPGHDETVKVDAVRF